MRAGREWVKRNLGFDPIAEPAPTNTFAVPLAKGPAATPEDLQREIIDFDSEGDEGRNFFAFSKATGLSRFTEIPWPAALRPQTDKTARRGTGGRLPKADVLIVTWTVDEGHATSRVLTPGKDSRNDYESYTHNFKRISSKMRRGSPALQAGRLGTYWTGKIGKKTIVVFKSDSHLSQDIKVAPVGDATLPNEDLWAQIIDETSPSLVITTGTGGGVGVTCEVGDVVASSVVRFDCQKWLAGTPFEHATYKSAPVQTTKFTTAARLFNANVDQLPPDNPRKPKILIGSTRPGSVVTTDFFGFDTSDDHWKLQGEGRVCEMGDAVLGMLLHKRQLAGIPVPRFVAVRNVSDPQIKAEGTRQDQAHLAAQIYKGFGRWSTVCSAIVCWALVAAE